MPPAPAQRIPSWHRGSERHFSGQQHPTHAQGNGPLLDSLLPAQTRRRCAGNTTRCMFASLLTVCHGLYF